MQMGGTAAFCGATAPRRCVLAGRKSKAWKTTTEDSEKGRRTRRVGDDVEVGDGGDSKLKTTAAQLKLAATDASTSWRTWLALE
jgi:hypothetical protein